MKKLLLLILMLCWAGFGAVRIVPSQYATIAEAVTVASNYDSIRIDEDQTVTTNITVKKGLTFYSANAIPVAIYADNCHAFYVEQDSVTWSNLHITRSTTPATTRYAIYSKYHKSGHKVLNCIIDKGAALSNAGGVWLESDNYAAVHYPSLIRGCLFTRVWQGVVITASRTTIIKNVTIDSCYFDSSNAGLMQNWKLTNSIFNRFSEIGLRGDSCKIDNVYLCNNPGGEAITTDDIGYILNNDTIQNVFYDSCSHNGINVDGLHNSIIRNIVFGRTTLGTTYLLGQHHENVYDSISGLRVSNVALANNHLAIFRGHKVNVVFDTICWVSTAAKKYSSDFGNETDSLFNAVLSYIPEGVDSLNDTTNVYPNFMSDSILDSTTFFFTKLKYASSDQGLNWRGEIINSLDTVFMADSFRIGFRVSALFRHDNKIKTADYKTKNSAYTGDTLSAKLIYKEHSSGTWVDGGTLTGRAGDSINLLISGLSYTTEYDGAVVIVGTSGGTTHMSDTTPTYTFTTGESPFSITTEPTNQTAVNQKPFSFNLSAAGEGITYKWFRTNTDTLVGSNNDTIKGIAKSKWDGAEFFCFAISGTDTAKSDTVTLKVNPETHLMPTVKTWAYTLQRMSADTIWHFWRDHYDIQIGMVNPDSAKVLMPNNTIIPYTMVTNLTKYNRTTGVYDDDLISLKTYCDNHYAEFGYIHPDSAIEACFVHASNPFTVNFTSGGSMDIPAYDPEDPKASRVPAVWEINSDWIVNMNTPIFKKWWRDSLVPFYTDSTDGIYLDVYNWPLSQQFPDGGNIREYTSTSAYYDSLRKATITFYDSIEATGKLFTVNNAMYESTDTNYLYYKNLSAVNREVMIYYYNEASSLRNLIVAAGNIGEYGNMALLHHRCGFPGDQNRDRIAGFACYLLAHGENTYYFTYNGGLSYGREFDTAAWHGLLEKDYGQPTSEVNWSWATGPDPTIPSATYQVWRRDFDSCIAIIKARPRSDVTEYGEPSITKHYIEGGPYQLLDEDGLPFDTITDTIALRNWEGAILVSLELGPTWTQQPVNDTIKGDGQTVSFHAEHNLDVEVAWYELGVGLALDGSPLEFTADIADTSKRFYAVAMWDGGEADTSDTVRIVYVGLSIEITAQPQNDTVISGQPGTFSVGYTGEDVQVAWYKNNIFTGITTDTLRTTGNNGDNVQAVLWNTLDTVSTNLAYLTVVSVPVDTTKIRSFDWINSSGNMFPASGWTITIDTGSGSYDVTTTITSQSEYGFVEIVPSVPLVIPGTYQVSFVNGDYSIVGSLSFVTQTNSKVIFYKPFKWGF